MLYAKYNYAVKSCRYAVQVCLLDESVLALHAVLLSEDTNAQRSSIGTGVQIDCSHCAGACKCMGVNECPNTRYVSDRTGLYGLTNLRT